MLPALLTSIQKYAEAVLGKSVKLRLNNEAVEANRATVKSELTTLKQENAKGERMLKSLYESLVSGLIDSDEYREMRDGYEAKFFAVGLNRHMNYLQIPLMKVPKGLPDVLTKEEVNRLISACGNTKHKAILLLAYGSGLRSGEVISLRVKDIDSKEMRIMVRGGKNKRDHYTILSQSTLDALREYWRIFRPNSPEGWLFPGSKNIGHITRAAVALAFDNCVNRTGITKEVSPHSLRHAFGTHLYEDGVELIKIKELLGHYRIQSTTVYVHLANTMKDIKSPADTMSIQHSVTPND